MDNHILVLYVLVALFVGSKLNAFLTEWRMGNALNSGIDLVKIILDTIYKMETAQAASRAAAVDAKMAETSDKFRSVAETIEALNKRTEDLRSQFMNRQQAPK